MHIRDDLFVTSGIKKGREVDRRGLDPLGRLSGNRYCTVRSVIESDTFWKKACPASLPRCGSPAGSSDHAARPPCPAL